MKNGAADRDGRLRKGDVILAVDGVNVIDATHRRVISLMGNAGKDGKVTLRVRRTHGIPQDDGRLLLITSHHNFLVSYMQAILSFYKDRFHNHTQGWALFFL